MSSYTWGLSEDVLLALTMEPTPHCPGVREAHHQPPPLTSTLPRHRLPAWLALVPLAILTLSVAAVLTRPETVSDQAPSFPVLLTPVYTVSPGAALPIAGLSVFTPTAVPTVPPPPLPSPALPLPQPTMLALPQATAPPVPIATQSAQRTSPPQHAANRSVPPPLAVALPTEPPPAPPTAIQPMSGSGPWGNDWSDTISRRAATIGRPTPSLAPDP